MNLETEDVRASAGELQSWSAREEDQDWAICAGVYASAGQGAALCLIICVAGLVCVLSVRASLEHRFSLVTVQTCL